MKSLKFALVPSYLSFVASAVSVVLVPSIVVVMLMVMLLLAISILLSLSLRRTRIENDTQFERGYKLIKAHAAVFMALFALAFLSGTPDFPDGNAAAVSLAGTGLFMLVLTYWQFDRAAGDFLDERIRQLPELVESEGDTAEEETR